MPHDRPLMQNPQHGVATSNTAQRPSHGKSMFLWIMLKPPREPHPPPSSSPLESPQPATYSASQSPYHSPLPLRNPSSTPIPPSSSHPLLPASPPTPSPLHPQHSTCTRMMLSLFTYSRSARKLASLDDSCGGVGGGEGGEAGGATAQA